MLKRPEPDVAGNSSVRNGTKSYDYSTAVFPLCPTRHRSSPASVSDRLPGRSVVTVTSRSAHQTFSR